VKSGLARIVTVIELLRAEQLGCTGAIIKRSGVCKVCGRQNGDNLALENVFDYHTLLPCDCTVQLMFEEKA